MDYLSEIEQLRQTLNQASHEYYVLDNPTMSDYDYDHMPVSYTHLLGYARL